MTPDANGNDTFRGLLPGEYDVQLDSGLPVGLTATADTGGTGAGSNAASGKTGEFTLTAGQAYDLADFGYQPAAGTAIIGDRVWNDAEGDGVQDAGESGIAGVTVELQDGVCTPNVNCLVATTADDGSYLFTSVAPGTYDVVVTDTGAVSPRPVIQMSLRRHAAPATVPI